MVRFCVLGITGLIGFGVWLGSALAEEQPIRVPVVHVTDLFRPHTDPDDHWDLAGQFALMRLGRVDLKAVLIDCPRPKWKKDPDVQAIGQLGAIVGAAVPVAVGVPASIPLSRLDAHRNDPALGGIRAIAEILRRSDRPVVITVTGWCRDLIALARLEPELFKRKCAAVYLNAGLGTQDLKRQEPLEWNVAIDPEAYRAVFDLPVPIYWLPCFEDLTSGQFHVARNGSFYRFTQGEILMRLDRPAQNYFLSMFRDGQRKESSTSTAGWWADLFGPVDAALLESESKQSRNMWCTAGMFHMVGRTVLADGRTADLAKREADPRLKPVFSFEPIAVECDAQSRTVWRFDPNAKDRFILQVHDTDRYEPAMTRALGRLLEAGLSGEKK